MDYKMDYKVVKWVKDILKKFQEWVLIIDYFFNK